MQGEAQGVGAGLAGIVLQFQLADAAAHGSIDRGGDGCAGVDQACALDAGGVVSIVLVNDGQGGADQQLLGQVGGLCIGQAVLGDHGLLDQGGDACHVGSCHGSTAHHGVGTGVVGVGTCAFVVSSIHDGGPDVAAGCGDLGLQLQAVACAPGGELGHFTSLIPGGDAVLLFQLGQVHGAVLGSLSDGCAVNTGDECAGHGCAFSVHVDQLGGGGILVIDQNGTDGVVGDGVAQGGIVVAPHELGGHIDLIQEADAAAALDQGDAVCALVLRVAVEITEACIVVVGVGAVAVHRDDLDGNVGVIAEHVAHGDAGGVDVGCCAAVAGLVSPLQVGLGLHGGVDGSDGQNAGIGGGCCDHGDLRVGGQIVVAVVVAHAGVVGVACGDHEQDAGLGQAVVGLAGDGVVLCKAVVRTQRQVHDVSAQNGCVFQCAQNGVLGCAGGLVVEDLHGQDLCVGGDAGEDDLAFFALDVTGDGTGNVGAVVAGGGTDVDVAVGVVSCEGDLQGFVQGVAFVGDVVALSTGGGDQLIVSQESLQRLGSPADAVLGGSVLEGVIGECLVDAADAGDVLTVFVIGGVLQVQTGVQNGDEHALAGVAGAPDLVDAHHVVAVAGDASIGLGQLRSLKDLLDLHAGNAGLGFQSCDLAVGDLDGHAVDQIGPLGQDGHLGLLVELFEGLQDLVLLGQELGGQSLGIGGCQEAGHGGTGGDALLVGVDALAEIVQHSGLGHFNDHGDDFVGSVTGGFLDGIPGDDAVETGLAHQLLGSQGGLSRRSPNRHQAYRQTNCQQHCQTTFHLSHLVSLPFTFSYIVIGGLLLRHAANHPHAIYQLIIQHFPYLRQGKYINIV